MYPKCETVLQAGARAVNRQPGGPRTHAPMYLSMAQAPVEERPNGAALRLNTQETGRPRTRARDHQHTQNPQTRADATLRERERERERDHSFF